MLPYYCPVCTAGCTLEAMTLCTLDVSECPVIQDLASGKIMDRRPTDADPNFPSEFSYKESGDYNVR